MSELKRRSMEEIRAEFYSLKIWLERHLETNTITRSTGKGGHDGDGNSWAAVAIPDWDVKQRLDEIEAALASAVDCLQCGKPIQYQQGTCPHCGYKEF